MRRTEINYKKKGLTQIIPILFVKNDNETAWMFGLGKYNISFVDGKNIPPINPVETELKEKPIQEERRFEINYKKEGLNQIIPILFVKNEKERAWLFGFGKYNIAIVKGNNITKPVRQGFASSNNSDSIFSSENEKKKALIIVAVCVVGIVAGGLLLYHFAKKKK